MAGEANLVCITRIAGADLSAKQYTAVKQNSSGQVVAAGAGEKALGILQNKPTSGQAATVAVGGVSKWIAGGVVAPDAEVAADADGKAKTAVANTTDTQVGAAADPLLGSYILGRNLTAANSVQNQVIEVLLTHTGASPGTVS
ncbi:MAG: hypothetical protein KJZ75_11220 [Hyphomonadaceae bacterium]|nr:hypothetical protein [Hyphomonadaceae bacterium]